MEMYKHCYDLTGRDMFPTMKFVRNQSDEVISSCPLKGKTTLPEVLQGKEEYEQSCIEIYYISDLHISYHISNTFSCKPSDAQIAAYIEKITRDLFSGEFGEKFDDLSLLSFFLEEIYLRIFQRRGCFTAHL